MPAEKNTQKVPFYCSPELELELRRLAEADGERSLSEYVRVVLSRHVFGHRRTPDDNGVGPDKAA